MSKKVETLYQGTHVSLMREVVSGWEFAHRPSASGIVVIVATTSDDCIILVEQYRPPLNALVLELPAGLAGDTLAVAGEDLLAAAKRELLEETGYISNSWSFMTMSSPSAGITSEVHNYVRAASCSRVGSGGGDETEDITTLLLSRQEFFAFVRRYSARPGHYISTTVLAGAALLGLAEDVVS